VKRILFDRTCGRSATARALIPALLPPMVAGAVAAMTIVNLLVQPIWGDQAWCFYVASQVLDGARLGKDIVETNPPTIVWISEIPVLLSRLLDVSPQTAMKIFLGPLTVLSVGWCASLVRGTAHAQSGTIALWLAIAIAYGTTVYSWEFVGQREHIMVLLMLPYLISSAIRLEGTSPPRWQGFAAGAAALVALALKPQHLVIVLGVEALLAYRHGILRSFTRPEASGAVLAAVVYCLAVWAFAPDYITKVVPLDFAAYTSYFHRSWVSLIVPSRTAKVVAVLALWVVVQRRLQHRALCTVLVIAAIGSTVGYLIQQKGDRYLFAPADAYFIILAAVIFVDIVTQLTRSPNRFVLQRWPRYAVALASGLTVGLFYFSPQFARAAATYDNDWAGSQVEVASALPAGTKVVVLGPNGISFDIVLDHHLEWASRFYGFWMLEAIFNAEAADGNAKPAQLARVADVARMMRAAANEDFERRKPNVVLVELCEDERISCGTSEVMEKADILRWFEQDPTFRTIWAGYALCRQIGYYDVWYAKNDKDVCRALASTQ
jgi:hypothetical protein